MVPQLKPEEMSGVTGDDGDDSGGDDYTALNDYQPQHQPKPEEEMYVDRKNNMVTLENISSDCCRPIRTKCDAGSSTCEEKIGIFISAE